MSLQIDRNTVSSTEITKGTVYIEMAGKTLLNVNVYSFNFFLACFHATKNKVGVCIVCSLPPTDVNIKYMIF